VIRPFAALAALIGSVGLHAGDGIPRVLPAKVSKAKGYAGPSGPTGKAKSQAAPFGAKYRARRRAHMRMQRESRRRNRGGAK
jgi:hypothetical protein